MNAKINQARLKRILEVNHSDWCVTPGQLAALLQAQDARLVVDVLDVECEADGTFENDYHNIVLPDGTLINGVSGFNLEPVI